MTVMSIWTQKGDQPAMIASFNNLAGTTDPAVTNDGTQGYGVGSVWINNAAGAMRWWECLSNATGAAVWVFSGAAYGAGGAAPNSEVVQFGSGSAVAGAEGNINRQVMVPAVSPNGLNADYVVGVYSLPASSFDVAGRGLNIIAQGSFAANNNSKRIKLIFNATTAVVGSVVTGGTTICDTGAVTTLANGVGWAVEANVFKYGAAGSNTQLGLHVSAQVGLTVSSLLVPTAVTATESGPILIAVTANAVTAGTDILTSFVELNAMN